MVAAFCLASHKQMPYSQAGKRFLGGWDKMKYIFFLLFLTIGTTCYGQSLQVIDGDTILLDGEEVNIRGIDAPELNQPYGINAKDAITLMLSKGQWTVSELSNRGPNGRMGNLINENGSSMAETLIEAGLAWSTDPKGIMPTKLQNRMKSAKAMKRGLWSDSNAVNPSNWRKNPAKYNANLALLAEAEYLAKQQRRAEEAERQAAWDALVATNPELAQKILADQAQAERDQALQDKIDSLQKGQAQLKSAIRAAESAANDAERAARNSGPSVGHTASGEVIFFH